MLFLAACSTTPDPAANEGDSAQTQGTRDDRLGDFMRDLPQGPRIVDADAEDFIGRPLAQFEGMAGPAALTRQEGENEFRRYDLGACRLYAVVSPAGGNVVSLAAGPAVSGQATPSFGECLGAAPMVGS